MAVAVRCVGRLQRLIPARRACLGVALAVIIWLARWARGSPTGGC